MKGKTVQFGEGTKNRSKDDEEEEELDPTTAKRLYEEGAFLIVLDLPPGTELGLDLKSWNTGTKFLGMKMIPPGVHFVHYSAVSKEGQVAPRTGHLWT